MLLLPYNDENPVKRTPFVTILLVAVNVAVFFFELELARAGQLESALRQWAVVPRDFQAGAGPEQVLDLFRSMFLHGGWLHLIGNMLYLGIFGDNVEDVFGSMTFLLFYLACGLVATAAQIVLSPNSTVPLVGASGAIAGVLGAYLLMFPGVRVRTLFWFIIILRTIRLPAVLVLGGWFIIQYLSAQNAVGASLSGGGVAYAAHVAGFLAGAIMTAVFVLGRGLRAAFS